MLADSGARRWPAAASLLTVVVFAVGGCTADPADQDSESAGIAEKFDLAEASFYLPPDGRPYYLYGDRYPFELSDRLPPAEVSLSGGTYYPRGSDGDDPHMRLSPDVKPQYADVDGDGTTDAVAVLEWTGEAGELNSAWLGVYVWLWRDGEALPLPRLAAWEWQNCPQQNMADLLVADAPVRVEAVGDVGCVNGDNAGDYLNPKPPPTATQIEVVDDVPISVTETGIGAADYCFFQQNLFTDAAEYEITADIAPRVAPDSDAAVMTGDGTARDGSPRQFAIDRLILRVGPEPDRDLYDGWIPAVVEFDDSPYRCGWVNWNDIGDSLKRL